MSNCEIYGKKYGKLRTAANENSTCPYEVNTGTSEAYEKLSHQALENQYTHITKKELTMTPYENCTAASEKSYRHLQCTRYLDITPGPYLFEQFSYDAGFWSPCNFLHTVW